MANVTKLNIGGTDYDIVDASVPSWAKQSTKPTYTANEISGLAGVATSGSYNDLTDKPTIPAAITVDSTITQNGTNPVQGSAIYSALAEKMERIVINTEENNGALTFTDFDGNALTHAQVREILNNPNNNVSLNYQGNEFQKTIGDEDWWEFEIRSFRATQFIDFTWATNRIIIDDSGSSNLNDYYVLINRTINGKALSSNITLSASDVGADVFVVNIENDGSDGYTCDKTNAEIYAAWLAGRNIVLITSSGYLYKLNLPPSQTDCEFSGDDYDDISGYRHYTIFTSNGQQQVIEVSVNFQEYLRSGTNIKTINNQSLLGSGNIEIESGGNVTVENVTDTGDVIKSLEPNIFYKFGTVNSLTIPLISGTDLAVYSGKFTIDSLSTALSFFVVPATVITAYSCPTITTGNTYEFNILDNVLMMQEI